MILRTYQEVAIARVLELFGRGLRRVLLALPTGGGKTVIAAALVLTYLLAAKRVLFLAHRRELIKQAFCKLVRGGIAPDQIGIIMAGTPWKIVDAIAPTPGAIEDDELYRLYARRRPHAPIQVGSIDTFRNHHKPLADLIIVDEAHRALAKSYCDVQLAYPDAHHLGLTATPIGPNGKPLENAYDELVIACTYTELVALGALVEPICYGLPPDKRADLRGVRMSGGDYKSEELARAVDKGELVGNIVDHWKKYGNDARTFCFAVNVAHSKHLAERFVTAGIAARHVDGNTETNERDDALAALRAGDAKVLCNCDVFTEGTDVPSVKTIILARPTRSVRLYLQQVGRGARPYEDEPFVVLDHAGCCRPADEGGFGLPQIVRSWSLKGLPKKEAGARQKPTKDCPQCYAMVSIAARTCIGCGFVFPIVETTDPPQEAEGELVRLNDPGASKPKPELTDKEEKALAHWNQIVAAWEEMNAERDREGLALRAGGWCMNQWRNETGRTWAPKGSKIPTLTDEQIEANKGRPTRKVVPLGTQIPIASTLATPQAEHRLARMLEEWSV